MANLYLSFLGTSNYVPCTYTYGETKVAGVRFVQEATTAIFCDNWTDSDRILIFTTEEAKKRNWLDGGYYDDAGKPIAGLASRLSALHLKSKIEAIDIPEGGSEAEIWQIFQIIYDHINECDQIVFDITHAFRSIPMLAMVVLPYARVMKNTTILGIYYGAFEILGHPSRVKELPMAQRLTPIFDLTPFSSLLDWTLAIDRFLGAGDASPVHKLAKCYLPPKIGQDQNDCSTAIQELAENLATFSKALGTCRCKDISSVAATLNRNLQQTLPVPLPIPAFEPLLDLVRQRMSGFTGNIIKDGVQAVKWCLEHNLIQQGCTILRETVISHVLTENERDLFDHNNRERVVYAANQSLKKTPAPLADANDKQFLDDLLTYFQSNKKLAKYIVGIGRLRNDINHCGLREQSKAADCFRSELQTFVDRMEQIV